MKTICTLFFLLLAQLSMAQTAAADNRPSDAITFQPIPKGPDIYGFFEGRIPCAGVVPQLQLVTDKECEKLKCRIELHRDPATSKPTTFKLRIVGAGEVQYQDGDSYRLLNMEGTWHVESGMPGDASAELYVLEPATVKTKLYLWKGDDNVLFVLDSNKNFRTGNQYYSYTFNRIVPVPAK